MPNYHLAIDIGASSGRHILGSAENGRFCLEEVYRFENRQLLKDGHDCWDIQHLWQSILEGLIACREAGKIPSSVGIDTWGVDFVLVDESGTVIGDPVAYRDRRTTGIDAWVDSKIPAVELYSRTGIQKAIFNTIYQLAALLHEHPEQLKKADRLLFIPDYLHYRLTGVMTNEYTIASTSGLLNARKRDWDGTVLDALGLPKRLFRPITMPCETVGRLRPEIREKVGFDTKVVLPATHDTGSAFLAVPAKDDHAVYLSSGTWSLLGIESESPFTSEASRLQNFTNEGGAWGRTRFLKNIMGLWMLQSLRRELNGTAYVQGKQSAGVSSKKWSFPDLIEAARAAEGFASVVDVNRDDFLSPDSMIEAIREECRRTAQPVPESVGELAQCIYSSLALCYRDAVKGLELLTGKPYTSINIVGGGCQDGYLNQRTANATGLKVYAGPIEGTAIGNILLQMISDREIPDLQTGRELIRESFSITEYTPE